MNNKRHQAIDGEAKAKTKVIKLGLDLHVRQVTECRQLDGSTPMPAQQSKRRTGNSGVSDAIKGSASAMVLCRCVAEGTVVEQRVARPLSSCQVKGARDGWGKSTGNPC
jgi:hypothetical protein